MFSSLFIWILLPVAIHVNGSPVTPRNNDFLPALLKFLQQNELTTYAGELASWSETDKGQQFVERLKTGKRTLYVASNKALGEGQRLRQTGSAQPMPFSATDDGSDPSEKRTNNVKCGRLVLPTLWDDPEFVNLGGRPQVQVIDAFSDDYRVLRGTKTNSTAKNVGTFRNVDVKEINTRITPPSSMKDTLSTCLVDNTPNGFPDFSSAAQTAGLLDDLNNKASTTVFVPISYPCEEAGRDDIENHVLWNNVLYSPQIRDEGTAITASGKTLRFEREGDQICVIYGSVKSRIIRTDVTTSNGVAHVIEKPLIRQ